MVVLSARHNVPRSAALMTAALSGLFCKPPIILCIGSDKVTGDCLGPLVGHLLTTYHNVQTFVYGTLQSPVTAANLHQTAAFIKERHPGQKVLAVDAALGAEQDVGVVRLHIGGIKPGSGVGKFFGSVGEYCLSAVVGRYSPDRIDAAFVPLGLVQSLSEFLARCVAASLNVRAPRLRLMDSFSYA